MTRWQLRTTPQFERAARRLDRQVLKKIKAYLDDLCELDDPRDRGKGLTGDLKGYWRYRVGDWRILVEIRDDELIIIAVALGHRSQIYRR